ncbi:MAG TPA: response regulator transcription factor [Ignavibacteriales bacterium]|nr:response regulator transcription factor [Ignavibacteriales bacterium]
MPSDIRVLVAEDHSIVRDGIISLIENIPGLYVVGEASNGQDLVEKYAALVPDVVISDISMPGMTGIEAIIEIKKKFPDAKVLFLSIHEGEEFIFHILKAGGMGLLSKNIIKGELIYAVKLVAQGGKYFGRGYTEEKLKEILERNTPADPVVVFQDTDLSRREIEVLRLVCDGYSSSEIAQTLEIGKKTVDTHRSSIMKKLGVENTSQLIKYAIKNRIVV